MSESAAEFRKLPLRSVIWGAFSLSWQNRAALFRAAAFPMLAVIGVSLFWDFLTWGDGFLAQLTPQIFYIVALSWLAVTVHRLVLLDEASTQSHFDASNGNRVSVYVLAFTAIGILFLASKTVLYNGIGIATGITYVAVGSEPKLVARSWLGWGSTIVSLWVIARLVLVLPSIAVDKGLRVSDAWRRSRGNAWRLAVVYGVLPWALSSLRWLLYRDEGSNFELALIIILGSLIAVVEIVALSLSYAALTASEQPAPPPTDPPA
jgi:hypothetical protein